MSMHLLHSLCAIFIELAEGPSRKPVGKADKGKKPTRTPRGKEEKEKMKYQFHRVECTSKLTSTWDTIFDIDLQHVNKDEFKQRVMVNPTT